jgi:hypothetical protein
MVTILFDNISFIDFDFAMYFSLRIPSSWVWVCELSNENNYGVKLIDMFVVVKAFNIIYFSNMKSLSGIFTYY